MPTQPPPLRNPSPTLLAMLATSAAWFAAAAAGVKLLDGEGEPLRIVGGALVAVPALLAPWLMRRRLRRLDELQARVESQGYLQGALFALAFGAVFFALQTLARATNAAGDPFNWGLALATMPPMALLFGALMMEVERKTLAGERG